MTLSAAHALLVSLSLLGCVSACASSSGARSRLASPPPQVAAPAPTFAERSAKTEGFDARLEPLLEKLDSQTAFGISAGICDAIADLVDEACDNAGAMQRQWESELGRRNDAVAPLNAAHRVCNRATGGRDFCDDLWAPDLRRREPAVCDPHARRWRSGRR